MRIFNGYIKNNSSLKNKTIAIVSFLWYNIWIRNHIDNAFCIIPPPPLPLLIHLLYPFLPSPIIPHQQILFLTCVKSVVVKHLMVAHLIFPNLVKICIIEVYHLKYYFESQLIYKWHYYRQTIFNQLYIMVFYVDIIGLSHSVVILW